MISMDSDVGGVPVFPSDSQSLSSMNEVIYELLNERQSPVA